MENKQNETDVVETVNNYQSANEIDFLYLVVIILRNKYFVFITTAIFGILSIIYALSADHYFASSVSLYPIIKEQGGAMSKLAVTLGFTAQEGSYLPDVVKSRRIAKMVILRKYETKAFKDSVNLIEYFKINKTLSNNRIMDLAIIRLGNNLTVKMDKETMLVKITIAMKEKKLASDVVMSICNAVRNYIQDEQMNSIKSSRRYTEFRLSESEKELTSRQNELIDFQEKNISVQSPFLKVEQSRRNNKVRLLLEVVTMLRKQRELLLIEEIKNKPIINILDVGDIHDIPVRPRKKRIVIFLTTIGFLLSVVFLILKDKYYDWSVIKKIKEQIQL